MMRALLVGAALLVAVGAILVQLRARRVPVRTSLKMAVFGAGFVVSVKMMLGGYLALQGEAEPAMVEVVGFYGSIDWRCCSGGSRSPCGGEEPQGQTHEFSPRFLLIKEQLASTPRLSSFNTSLRNSRASRPPRSRRGWRGWHS